MDLTVLVILLALGYFFGRFAEKRHYKSIIEREAQYRDIIVIASRFPPAQHLMQPADASSLVTGSVVPIHPLSEGQ